MQTIIRCNRCNSSYSVDMTWYGKNIICPYCHASQLFVHKDNKVEYNKTNSSLYLILGGLGMAFFVFVIIVIAGVWAGTRSNEITTTSTYTQDYSNGDSALSLKGEMAKEYIENELPYSQRRALMGGGTLDDEANAIANLMESGNLEGAAEYLQSCGD